MNWDEIFVLGWAPHPQWFQWLHPGLVALSVVVAVATAAVVVTAGSLPFVGLIVPNVVRLVLGDNVRRSVLWVALIGAGLTVLCDLVGRLLIAPYEIPVGSVLGVLGSALFLALILRRRKGRA